MIPEARIDFGHLLTRQAISVELPAMVNASVDLAGFKPYPLMRFEPTSKPPTDIFFRNIFLVDDDPETAFIIGFMLRRNGFCMTSVSGDNAPALAYAYLGSLSALERAKIGLVIADFSMPDVHGVALLEVLRTNLLKRTPAAIITNTPLGDIRQRGEAYVGIINTMHRLGVEAWSKIDFSAHPLGTLRAIQAVRAGTPRHTIRVASLD